MSGAGRTLRILAALGLAATAATAATVGSRELPDLSGSWALERRAARTESATGPRDEETGRLPRRTEGSGGAQRPSGEERLPRAERERLAALARAAERLEIRREGGGFSIEDALGRVWPAPADGSERAVGGSDGSVTYVRSEWGEWEGLRLWRVRAGEPTVQETFTLAAEGNELLVETTFPGARWSAAPILRRYRRAPEGPSNAP
jgi:hypothetical protein